MSLEKSRLFNIYLKVIIYIYTPHGCEGFLYVSVAGGDMGINGNI